MRVANRWVADNGAFVSWRADLDGVGLDSLLVWLRRVLTAGEGLDVYCVREAPAVGYRWRAGYGLADHLDRRYRESGEVDVFHFSGRGLQPVDGGRLRVFARVGYAGPGGQLVESEVDDLGALLRTLRPADVEAAGRLMSRCPPVDVDGSLVRAGAEGRVRVRFSLLTDIWLPWVDGFLEERPRADAKFDNRPLAGRHTVRLNEFLQVARSEALAAGGRWSVDEPWTREDLLDAIDDAGVRLDVPPPPGAVLD